jgi:hypoxia up-regulated 1
VDGKQPVAAQQQEEEASVGDGDKAEEEDAAAEAAAAAANATAAAEAAAAAAAADAAANATDEGGDKAKAAAAAAAAAAAPAAPPAKPQPVVHRAVLTVTAHYEGLRLRPHTGEEKALSAARLAALRLRDELKREKADARNSLEGYLYDVRNKLADQEEAAAQVSTEEQRSAILSAVEAADEWMYDEGRDVAAAVYKAKMGEVKALAEPVFLRMKEGPGGLRAAALEAGRKNVAEIRAMVKKWNITMPWLTGNDTAPLLEEAGRVEGWLDEMEAAQGKLAGHEAPAFLSKDVEPQLKKMKEMALRLARKPAPPPPPKPKANKTAEANATATAGGAGNDTTVEVEKEEGAAAAEGGAEAGAGEEAKTAAGDEL